MILKILYVKNSLQVQLSLGFFGKIFTDWFRNGSDGHIFSISYKFVNFFLPLNTAIYRTSNSPREQDEPDPHFIYIPLQAV